MPPGSTDVPSRFLEHLNYIPSFKSPSDAGSLSYETLRAWFADPQNADQQDIYVSPVVIPVDLLYLLSIGFFLGTLSRFAVLRVPSLAGPPGSGGSSP